MAALSWPTGSVSGPGRYREKSSRNSSTDCSCARIPDASKQPRMTTPIPPNVKEERIHGLPESAARQEAVTALYRAMPAVQEKAVGPSRRETVADGKAVNGSPV